MPRFIQPLAPADDQDFGSVGAAARKRVEVGEVIGKVDGRKEGVQRQQPRYGYSCRPLRGAFAGCTAPRRDTLPNRPPTQRRHHIQREERGQNIAVEFLRAHRHAQHEDQREEQQRGGSAAHQRRCKELSPAPAHDGRSHQPHNHPRRRAEEPCHRIEEKARVGHGLPHEVVDVGVALYVVAHLNGHARKGAHWMHPHGGPEDDKGERGDDAPQHIAARHAPPLVASLGVAAADEFKRNQQRARGHKEDGGRFRKPRQPHDEARSEQIDAPPSCI